MAKFLAISFISLLLVIHIDFGLSQSNVARFAAPFRPNSQPQRRPLTPLSEQFTTTTTTSPPSTTTAPKAEALVNIKESDEVSEVADGGPYDDQPVLLNAAGGGGGGGDGAAPTTVSANLEHYSPDKSDLKPELDESAAVSFKSPIISLKNATTPPESAPPAAPGQPSPSNHTSSSPYHLFDPLGLKIYFFSRAILANHSDGLLFIPTDRESIETALKGKFNPKLPTRLIIHGAFPGAPQLAWMYEAKDKFLNDSINEGDTNVFIVEWLRGAEISLVDQQLINARMVGYQLGHFLLMAKDLFGLQSERVHVITHSIAAFSAHEMSRYVNLGRITALDPGGPSFHLLPVDSRLNPLSAFFVDAIHTDAGNASKGDLGRGTSIAVGHVDFYPNGGEDQPGCGLRRLEEIFNPLPLMSGPLSSSGSGGLRQSVSHAIQRLLQPCHHFRAIDYFLESIQPPVIFDKSPPLINNSSSGANDSSAIVKRHYYQPLVGRNDYIKCRMIAYECSCYEDFLRGVCNGEALTPNSKSVELGFYSLNSRDSSGIPIHAIPVDPLSASRSLIESGYYLITRARKPYCIYHYYLKVNFGNWTTSRGVGVAGRGGALYLMVYGVRGSFETRLLGGPEGFRAGSFASVVATHEGDIGPLSHVTVAWLPPPTLNLFVDVPFYLKNVEYWPMTVQSAPIRSSHYRVLCPVSGGSKASVNSTGHPNIRISPFYRYSFFSNVTGCIL